MRLMRRQVLRMLTTMQATSSPRMSATELPDGHRNVLTKRSSIDSICVCDNVAVSYDQLVTILKLYVVPMLIRTTLPNLVHRRNCIDTLDD